MTPRQQRAHLRAWLVLGPLILLGLVLGVALRPGSAARTPAPEAGP